MRMVRFESRVGECDLIVMGGMRGSPESCCTKDKSLLRSVPLPDSNLREECGYPWS